MDYRTSQNLGPSCLGLPVAAGWLICGACALNFALSTTAYSAPKAKGANTVNEVQVAKPGLPAPELISSTPISGAPLARASFYGVGDGLAGKRTSSGERFNPKAMTAAHRTYPFGTILKVTNPANGKAVMVRVNDRGPFQRGKELDLSAGAAEALGFQRLGVAKVRIEQVTSGGIRTVSSSSSEPAMVEDNL